MATTGRTKKTKSVLDRDRYTADFTSGQLVIAICGLLLAALLCFLLGVVVGRYERASERPRIAAVVEEVSKEIEPSVQAVIPPPAPKPISKPVPQPVSTAPPAPVARVEAPDEPVAPAQASLPVVQKEDPAIVIAPLPDEPAMASASAATPPPAQQPQAATASTPPANSVGPSYGIQLAAFGDVENAEKARERLLANTELEADLVQAGQWVRVIIGDYRDRKEAEAACLELRQKPGFRDCYVVTRPD